MPDLSATSREVFARASQMRACARSVLDDRSPRQIHAPFSGCTHTARCALRSRSQKPIRRITNRGSIRIANITSAQMPGA